MRVLVMLVYGFVNTFGITQPTQAGAERAARVLGVAMMVALPVAVGMGYLIRSVWLH